jgi:Uma2 family endonuclease
VPGHARDYLAAHPARPALLVEVAESSLAFDRGHKGSLYARADVADYWIVNLVDGVLEVYRRPALDRSADFGWRYLDVRALRPGATIAPLARPDVTVAVADLLP